jgi:hypothetical protein
MLTPTVTELARLSPHRRDADPLWLRAGGIPRTGRAARRALEGPERLASITTIATSFAAVRSRIPADSLGRPADSLRAPR